MARQKKVYEFFNTYDNIYSSVPEYLLLKSKGEKDEYIQRKLVIDWFNNHFGKRKATPLNKIAAELGFPKSGNCVKFRHLVAKLVEEEKRPFVSCGKGYYQASTAEEVGENIDQEEARKKGITRRINALQKIKSQFPQHYPQKTINQWTEDKQ